MTYYYLPITLAAAASTTIHAGKRDEFNPFDKWDSAVFKTNRMDENITPDDWNKDDLLDLSESDDLLDLSESDDLLDLSESDDLPEPMSRDDSESQSEIDRFAGFEPNNVKPYQVTLNVYKFKLIKKVKTRVIYHSGIEMFGKEFAFFKKGGIVQEAKPKICRNPNWVFQKSVVLGTGYGTPKEVMDIIEGMKKDWTGKSYNTFTRNDNHFTNALSMALVNKPIPSYVKRLSKKVPTMKNPFKRSGKKSNGFTVEGLLPEAEGDVTVSETVDETVDEGVEKSKKGRKNYMINRAKKYLPRKFKRTSKSSDNFKSVEEQE